MESKVAVMGGSFNPPTIAHLKLMQAAVDAIDARLGLFVPAAHGYVARKMKRQGWQKDTLSEAIRLELLESLCRKDERLAVSKVQINRTEWGYDYEMLLDLQKEYPKDELYFVTGSDKLYVLPRWHKIDKLLEDFQILVAKRGEDNLNKIKRACPFIAEHWERFHVFPVPDEISAISSSAFREKLHNHDKAARELVTQESWEILEKKGKVPWNMLAV